MPHKSINRRNFLQQGAIITGGVALTPLVGYSTPKSVSAKSALADEPTWYQKPLRMLQTVLREPDATNYNAQAVVDYMLKTDCNTLVVNAGGIIDFFQNPLPAANINTFMGKNDILRDITNACHSAGIKVIGRVDFRGVEEKIFRQFPDWFSYDETGKPIQLGYTRPQLYASCYASYHRNEHAEEFIQYIIREYDIDGIWHNSIGVGGICHCSRCKASYKAKMGDNLPVYATATDETLKQYMVWKSDVADQHMRRMKDTVKAFGADKAYSAEVFSMFESGGKVDSGIDLYNAREHFDYLVSVAFLTENSEHIHYEDLNYANTIVRFLKSMAPEKEAVILYGGNGTAHRYVMDPPQDLKIWLWEGLSAGGRFWNCSFTGQYPDATHDRRNAYNHQGTYSFIKKYEHLLAHHVPVANVGIYYSRPTRLFYRNKPTEGDSFDEAIKGVERVLAENHIPYHFIPDDQVSTDRLNKYQVIILPDVKCLSEREIELLRNFVGKGGKLLATYETSLYDEDGLPKQNFGLANVFGCRFTGDKVNTRKDCYQFINDPAHPLASPDSAKTELFINAGFTLLCEAAPEARMVCTYSPLVHNQPPEKAWIDQWGKKHPTVLEHSYGKGRVIYFANQPDKVTYTMGHPDMSNLMLRGIQYLAGEANPPVTTNAPESVHLGLTKSAKTEGEYILSLVNTTSGQGRPVRRLVPVNEIKVVLNIPGSSLKKFEVMKSQGECKVEVRNGKVEVAVEKLEDYFSLFVKMGI
ncbi:MAG: beta-galactosidase trimerization domain-containing protein [Imperialibacter sp.]|uniref:alpha-amylase family protein n=1 Tax=Imperialibacter sp. TaxID=2038411 RepID=UPI0032EB8DA5